MSKLSIVYLIFIFYLLGTIGAFAQEKNDKNTVKESLAPLQTAVPSLSIAPDARGAGLGDVGAATTPDVNAQFWNASKYAFHYSQSGISLTYTPWMQRLVNDMALVNLTGFYKLGLNDNQALSGSLRYFTLGEIALQQADKGAYMTVNPYDVAVDIAYSRKLSESYSMAVTLRYIHSDQGIDMNQEALKGNAFAADVSGYLEKYVNVGNSESLFTFGYNISNIGTRISFDGGQKNHFLPTNLRLGLGFLYPLDDINTLGFYADASKYLVPTKPLVSGTTPEEIEEQTKAEEEYNNMSPIKGIFKSFHDAPGGFSEEMKEILYSAGVEYSHDNRFFVRGGYFHEHEMKGPRRFFSLGLGFKMSVFQIDASYLISTVQNNPLDQTLRFSLSFDMDGIKNLFRR